MKYKSHVYCHSKMFKWQVENHSDKYVENLILMEEENISLINFLTIYDCGIRRQWLQVLFKPQWLQVL